MKKTKVIIMGAAGRDFHDFNTFFRDNSDYEVVCFTATQIPNISGRKYPKELTGKLYPNGIPIFPEEQLPGLIKKHNVDEVVFSYSDISHEYVMHKASLVLDCGAKFTLLGSRFTQIKSKKPIISVCAVRTGSGKSQTSRKIVDILKKKGKKVVAIRHPMPYGDLRKQIWQRFATYEDMIKHKCTIEEREEYEPYVERGLVVFSGVDYGKILEEAEKEAEIIIWDGGNNDYPFYKPDLHFVVVDPLRPGHEIKYHPGETNARMADVIIINKMNTAKPEDIETVEKNVKEINPNAVVIKANSAITVDEPEKIKGKRVVIVEDGPTLTHGEMIFGAGVIAAKNHGCEIVDPRPHAVGSIKETYKKFSHLGALLPAMGYGKKQIRELEQTINACDCDVVVVGTPIDLTKILKVNKPAVRVRYDLEEIGKPDLKDVLKKFI